VDYFLGAFYASGLFIGLLLELLLWIIFFELKFYSLFFSAYIFFHHTNLIVYRITHMVYHERSAQHLGFWFWGPPSVVMLKI